MQRRNFNKMLALGPALLGVNTLQANENNNFYCKPKMIKPPALQKGDTVALVSPASPINPEKFSFAISNLENMGLKPKYTNAVFNKTGYLAGTDDERIQDFHNMIADPEVKAIWCLRGGYGCTRILPKLDYNLIKKNPKIIIGYSDITALILGIHSQTGLIGFHGPVAISEVFTPFSSSQAEAVLFGKSSIPHVIPYQIQSVEKYAAGQEPYIINSGKATGALLGGNLSLLVCLPGTKYAPSYKDKIVFIEDVGEKPYRIDRMLTFLLESTDINKASGIVLGVFNDCDTTDPESSLTLKDVLTDRLGPLNIPCFYGFTFGHVSDICTFPMGIDAEMNTSDMTVSLLEQSVKI
ncbi:MAG: LD-carboxypeptidase [Saprospiraceae bacterium]|nr:LD-carboxypeptidase [Saprospiraceae bacterium]